MLSAISVISTKLELAVIVLPSYIKSLSRLMIRLSSFNRFKKVSLSHDVAKAEVMKLKLV